MPRLTLLVLLCTTWSVPAAGARVRVHLVAATGEAVPANRAVHARLGERVNLYAVLQVGRRYYSVAPAIRLGRRRIRPPLLRPLAELGAVQLRWSRVEPRPHHVETPPPNRGNQAYSNAVLFGPTHGKWIGYDTIEYHATPIRGARGGKLSVTRTRPSHPRVDVNGGLGTMRYKVEARLPGGETVASPGEEATSRAGISPRVQRVTFRSDDSFVGHLRGYFNVPNVFGSAGHGRTAQAELYQGADCADVIIGAARALGGKIPYTSVLGLRRYARPTTKRLLLRKDGVFDEEGKRRVSPRFGEEIRTGDLMLIDYAGFTGSPRRWDHIAVVGRDAGKHGVFDPQDPVLHMGYLYGLTEGAASSEAPAYVQFLRFRPSILRAFRRTQRRLARRRTISSR